MAQEPEPQRDPILDFSTAVTGSLSFVPSLDLLDDPPAPKDDAEVSTPDPRPAPASRDASLQIGSLREVP